MLECCVFKNSKNLSVSEWQLKRHKISSTYCIIKDKSDQDQGENPWRHNLYCHISHFGKENMKKLLELHFF